MSRSGRIKRETAYQAFTRQILDIRERKVLPHGNLLLAINSANVLMEHSPADNAMNSTRQCNECLGVLSALEAGAYGSAHVDHAAVGAGTQKKELHLLAMSVEKRMHEMETLLQVTRHISSGLLLEDVLERIYHSFQGIIPYNRIGFSLIGEDGKTLVSHWAKSDYERVRLPVGYSAPLAGSSLQRIMNTGEPRILNDLEVYLSEHPHSASTRLIVREGIRSSLTCPLVSNGVPIGFLFFSSKERNAYADAHVDTFLQIADHVAVLVEKGRLMSEIQRQNQEIERQNSELRRVNEMKNYFLGVVAHDLRSPVASIQMAGSLLYHGRDSLPEDLRLSFLKDISRHADYVIDLLSDLLDVAQIESGQLSIVKESMPIHDFLQEAVDRHTQLASPKGTRLVLQPPLEGSVTADARRLRQVLDNLVSNAIKYSPPGSTVTIGATYASGKWRFFVQDEGPGIAPEDRSRLFLNFARLSAEPTAGEKSTGLGLAIAKNLVEAHNGQIGVESGHGRGSTFWFTIPADRRSIEARNYLPELAHIL